MKKLVCMILQDQDSQEITIDKHDCIEQLQPADVNRSAQNERRLDKEENSVLSLISDHIS